MAFVYGSSVFFAPAVEKSAVVILLSSYCEINVNFGKQISIRCLGVDELKFKGL